MHNDIITAVFIITLEQNHDVYHLYHPLHGDVYGDYHDISTIMVWQKQQQQRWWIQKQ